ncbi:hypothetical protein DFH27DRAFT_618955 [Peziza echinospora]|nr:hypothetical protein DFH27DRAFT_618955 [Peziza echinospora]
MVAHARVQAAHGQPPTALASLSVKFHATSSNLTVLRFRQLSTLNQQARTTSTPKSHFQSGI